MIECNQCVDIDTLDTECPDEPHHGETAYCGECGAEYYIEYSGNTLNANEQAEFNHPELKKV